MKDVPETNPQISGKLLPDRDAILRKTHYGLNIYAFILRNFYPDEIVFFLVWKGLFPCQKSLQ